MFSAIYIKVENDQQSDALVIRKKIGAVGTVGINRPAKRNCVNHSTADQLLEAFKEFDQDDSVCAIVLHGIGGNFCAGYDLQELSTADASILRRGPMVSNLYVYSIPINLIKSYFTLICVDRVHLGC